MKIPPARADRFCAAPDADVRLVLIYGSNEGLVRAPRRSLRQGRPRRMPTIPFASPASIRRFCVTSRDGSPTRRRRSRLSAVGVPSRLRGATEAVVPAIRSCLALPATESLVVAEAGPLTPRSGLRKLCEQEGSLAAIACYDESAEGAARLIETLCAKRGITVASETAAWLAERLGSDRRQIESGVEKLAVYLGEGGPEGGVLTQEVAEACVGDATEASADEVAASGSCPATVKGWNRAMDAGALRRGFSRSPFSAPPPGALARLHLAAAALEGGASRADAMGSLKPPVFPRERAAFGQEMGALAKRPRRPRAGAADPCRARLQGLGGAPEAICWQTLLRIARAASRQSA